MSRLLHNHYFRHEDYTLPLSLAQTTPGIKEQKLSFLMNERLAALGQVASGIAHEISNPLATIKACAEGLLRRVEHKKFDPLLFKNYLEIIEEEIGRCNRITRSILSFVQDAENERQTVDIHAILDKVLETMCFQGRLRQIKVLREYCPMTLSISANEGGLRQVFLSIIVNALDAMGDNGILTITTGVEEDTIFVKISNTGPAISASLLERIFDPFFTTKSKSGGTGLGLYIANNIVKTHHGAIHVVSEETRGTTFTILLPL